MPTPLYFMSTTGEMRPCAKTAEETISDALYQAGVEGALLLPVHHRGQRGVCQVDDVEGAD